MQKGKKFVNFALISTYGTTMVLHKKGVNGMVDEKVTVISSFSTLLFFLLLKLGMPLLHLVIFMKVTVIFSNKTGARLIIYTDCQLV